jgi:hypothetical protein
VLQLIVTVKVASSSQFPFTLMMEAIVSSEKSVLTIAIQRNIPDDVTIHSENLPIFKEVFETVWLN